MSPHFLLTPRHKAHQNIFNEINSRTSIVKTMCRCVLNVINVNLKPTSYYYITVKSVCPCLPKFELNQIGHNSVNFEATASRFCMVVALEEEDKVVEVDDDKDEDDNNNNDQVSNHVFLHFFAFFFVLFFAFFIFSAFLMFFPKVVFFQRLFPKVII